jgi:hypothetical protein
VSGVATEHATPLSLEMFEMIINICNVFPSLNPISIRDTDELEVINLINKMICKGKHHEEMVNQPKKQRVLKYADEVNWC